MSDQLVTVIFDGPHPLPHGGTLTRIVTLDEHGCELMWGSLDCRLPVGQYDTWEYAPTAEHPDRELFGWPEGITTDWSFYNNVDEGWAVPSYEGGELAALVEVAERLELGLPYHEPCAVAAPEPTGRDGLTLVARDGLTLA
jgi:hypothetical protein